MERLRQSDLFSTPAQGDLFGPPPVRVRRKMLAMLGQLRGAEECPWSACELGRNKVIFPQMANWLPEEEAASLRREFAAEVARLEAAGR
jgi:hypothetical protein